MENQIQSSPQEAIREQLRQIIKFHNRSKAAVARAAKMSPADRSRNASTGGKVAGRLTKERGTGIFGRTKEQRVKDAREAGLIGGKVTAAIPGHMTRAAEAAGRANVESGQIAALGRSTAELQIGIHNPETRLEFASMGGKVQGPINVENGTMEYARHVWFHVTNKYKPKKPCRFCNPPKDLKEPQ
jgi:hypothetical protein